MSRVIWVTEGFEFMRPEWIDLLTPQIDLIPPHVLALAS